jgi:hypothetical protein
MAEKASKAEVNYREGTRSRHCGICTKFEPPHACRHVAGKIEASDVCDRFVRKLYDHERSQKESR